MPMIFQWADAPKGGFIPEARAIRQAVDSRVPVSVAQRLKDPVFANEVMASEGFDFISLTRAFHADPYYVQKLIAGQPEAILPCISCNTCVNLTGSRQPTGCAVNPAATYESTRTFQKVADPKRVMVIGGGIAGLQAARLLAMQGHVVSLFDADDKLGGQINASQAVMPDYGLIIDWLVRQMETLAVKVVLNQTVTVADVKRQNPDAVVVAAGARARALRAQERDVDVPYFDVFSALKRPVGEWRGEVAILGGDMASCMVAKHLGQQKVKVHLIEPSAAFAADWQFNGTLLTTELDASKHVVLHPETTAELISGNQVEMRSRGEFSILTVSAVIVGGRESNISLSEALKRSDLAASVHTIGDAVRVRDLYAASQEAAEVAAAISGS